jgi:cbb3-type cytochrome oxidase subunit 3
MIGVTVFGLLLTPVFYVLLRREQKAPAAESTELLLAQATSITYTGKRLIIRDTGPGGV